MPTTPDARACEQVGPNGFLCTLPIGHAGQHEAHGCGQGQCENPWGPYPWEERAASQVATYKPLYGSVGLPTDDKIRKSDYPLYSFMFEYFPDAWLAVVAVAVAGNKQHNPGQPLHWAREKSTDQMNTAWRHQWDYGRGVKKDTDGQWHLGKAIWRLMAQLQLDIEEERRNNDQ